MKDKETLINEILAEWNPIDVPYDIAKTEYKGYIFEILIASASESELTKCLENILTNKMGLDYSNNISFHKEELKKVVSKILSVV